MTGYECYQIYLALRLHFQQDSYDYFKYNKKVKSSVSAYQKRNDKIFFEHLGRETERNVMRYFLATFVSHQQGGIGLDDKSQLEKNFMNWRKRLESLPYVFKEECTALLEQIIEKKHRQFDEHPEFTELFVCKKGKHPIILKALLGKYISMETFVILNQLLGFTSDFDKMMQDDHTWKEYGRIVRKYDPFLNLNLLSYRGILKRVIEDTEVLPSELIENCGRDENDRPGGAFVPFTHRDLEVV